MQKPRITAGLAKGIRLEVPDTARPITDRMRLSIFDKLAGLIEDATVLDLFAGAGTLGLEALSRGATSATFVDSSPKSKYVLNQNIKSTKVENRIKIILKQANSYVESIVTSGDKFDLVFADPPFPDVGKFHYTRTKDILAEEGIFVFRIPAEFKLLPSSELELIELAEYGSSKVAFFTKAK